MHVCHFPLTLKVTVSVCVRLGNTPFNCCSFHTAAPWSWEREPCDNNQLYWSVMTGQGCGGRAEQIWWMSWRRGETANRESIWPGEGSGCQETNRDSAFWEMSTFRKFNSQGLPSCSSSALLFSSSSTFFHSPPLSSTSSPHCTPRHHALTPWSSLWLLLNISI